MDKKDHPDNLYLTCQSCNSSLSYKFPNEELKKKVVITNSGNSDNEEGDVVYRSNVKDVNKDLKESGKKPIKTSQELA